MIKMLKPLYLVVLLSFSSIAENKEVKLAPKFTDYKVTVQKKFNRNTKLNLSNKKNRQFKTLLTSSLSEPPNFAGKFVIATWGCGSSCQRHAIVNKTNGEVFWPKEIEASFYIFSCEFEALDYKHDSKLLIVHEQKQEDKVTKSFYFWDGHTMIKLYSELKTYNNQCNLN